MRTDGRGRVRLDVREEVAMAAGHDHGAGEASDRRILWTVALNVALTVAQIVGGALAGSVALAADALHNLNDALALVIVYVARRVSRRRADRRRTFGYERAQTVGATINLVALAVVGLFLAYESITRFFDPREVDGWTVVVLGGIALAVDVLTVVLLVSMRKGSSNVRAAFVHNLSDALASLAVVVGGIFILTLGWVWVDPLLSLLIVAYVAWQVVRMLPENVRILMESVPPGLDLDDVVAQIVAVDGVVDAHHLHVWMLDEERRALEAHVVIERPRVHDLERIKHDVKRRLRDELGVHHSTLEIEVDDGPEGAGHERSMIVQDAP